MEQSIGKRLSFLLNLLLVHPLSLGNPTEAGNSDGSTSSTVAFSCVSAVLFITIAFLSAQQSTENNRSYSIWILTVIILVVGTVAISLLLFLKFCSHSYDIIRRQHLEDRSNKLEIKFLWFSGLGMLLRTGVSFAIEIECVKYFPHARGVLEILSSVQKILYMLFQMCFLTYLRNVRLVGGVLINYLIGGILLVNVSIWMAYIISQVPVNYTSQTNNISTPSIHISNITNWDYCYRNSKIHKISKYLSPILLTVSMIFLMLSSKFLIRLWPSIQTTSHIINVCTEDEGECSYKTHTETSDRPTGSLLKTIRIVSFFIGFLIDAPFFTMAILMRFIYADDVITVKVFWDVFVIVYLTIAVLVILLGIHNMNLDRLEKLPVEMWDFVLMVCMAGNVIMNILGCASVLVCHVERPITIFTKNILNLCLTYYHTMYITVARRIPHLVLCKSGTVLFIHILMFCSFLGRWLLQTFLLSSQGMYILKEGEACLFPNEKSWLTLQYFLIPLNTFYDFQSFVFYYGKLW